MGWVSIRKIFRFLSSLQASINIGSREARMRKIRAALPKLTEWENRLTTEIQNLLRNFALEHGSWTGEEVRPGVAPWAAPEDVRRAKIFLIGAIFVLIPDSIISGYLFELMKLPFSAGLASFPLLSSMLGFRWKRTKWTLWSTSFAKIP